MIPASRIPGRLPPARCPKVLIAVAFLPAVAALLSVALLPSDCAHSAGAVATSNTRVKISMHREGDVTHVSVENSELTEVTVTFDFSTVNLESEVTFPHTATFGPGTSEAFTLRPAYADANWEYSYTNYYKLGSSVARHDDSCHYRLPYKAGRSYRVTQAYNGRFSHKGSNQYAIDWKMPEGTPVHAARAGTVVKVRDDSDRGGPSMEYDRYNNFVLIRHDDGTLGHYCHLQKAGAQVRPGDRVEAGDWIARSGNTGFSSGAHLHFAVFKTRSGRERVSLPVKFEIDGREGVTLKEGRNYRAAPLPDAEPALLAAQQD